MSEPYWSDGTVTLYLGDCREVLPALGVTADCIVADPPYGETSLAWDRWPDGWLDAAAEVTRSLWCFGSLRMYLEHAGEFADWKLSQDVIWEKHNGSGFATDRFRRVHETAAHWYRGSWRDVRHDVPRVAAEFDAKDRSISGGSSVTPHTGTIGPHRYEDDGLRLARSVQRVPSVRGATAIHQTEKPLGILRPLIEYACKSGGLVVDCFAGSGSTLDAARILGRRSIGVELFEPHAEKAAKRLSQMVLEAS